MKRLAELLLLVSCAIAPLCFARAEPAAAERAPATSVAGTEDAATEPMYLIFDKGYWGLIDARGKVVLPARFEQIAGHPYGIPPGQAMPPGPSAAIAIWDAGPIVEQLIPVRLDGQAALALRDGHLLAQGKFQEFRGLLSEDRIAVRVDGKFGFATGRGEMVIPATFDEVRSFEQGFAFVRRDDRWGIVDRDGRTVAKPTWDEVWVVSPKDSLAAVRIGSQWGVVERSGKTLLPVRFEFLGRPIPPLIFGIDGGRPVYLRLDGSVAFEVQCPGGTKARGYPFANSAAVVECGGKSGLVDTSGKFLLAPSFDLILGFQEGLACVTSGGKSGVIDISGNFVLPLTAGGPCEFSEGLAAFRGSNGRWGFMDLAGSVVIAPRFEGHGPFRHGIASVSEGGKAGYIDRRGAWIIAPQFRRASNFRGQLAVVEIPVSRDTLELRYIDRTGQTVYRMPVSGGFIFDKQTLRRFSEAASPQR